MSVFIGYKFCKYYVRGSKLRWHHRHAITTVCKTHWSAKSDKFANGRYGVQGHEYLVSADTDRLAGQEVVGRCLLVETTRPTPASACYGSLRPRPIARPRPRVGAAAVLRIRISYSL